MCDRPIRWLWCGLLLCGLQWCGLRSGGLGWGPTRLWATDWYVDPLLGDDILNGRAPTPVGQSNGPFRSLRKALGQVEPGDVLHLAATGGPYYEAISLAGRRHSGTEAYPFTIDGHGAILSGARSVPPEAWTLVGNDVWRFTPRRKGTYLLLQGHQPLPEQPTPFEAVRPPPLNPGSWTVWRGDVYYQADPNPLLTPTELPLAYAFETTGLSLVDVRHVEIRNLTVQHYRLDGIALHDRCQRVILRNVTLRENARAGLAVGGSSLAGVVDSTLEGNRQAQLWNSESAQTELLDTRLGQAPGRPLRLLGGHVLVDGMEVEETPANIPPAEARPKTTPPAEPPPAEKTAPQS